MILWGRASSVNVQKVLWGLDELGLGYEHQIVGGKYGGLDKPDFAALTPVRRVPVLQDGDLALWESNTILRYLAQREGRLGAGDPLVDMWMEFGSTTLQPPFIGMFWQRVRMLPEQQSANALAAHVKGLTAASTQLDLALSDGRDFVAGPKFTMADVALGSLFFRILDTNPDILAKHKHVARWHKSIASRQAYQTWIATSYDELKAVP